MNILFINSFDVSPHLGGTERITDTLCKEFSKSNKNKCFLAYYNNIDNRYILTKFTDKIHLKNHRQINNLITFIKKHNINVAILQGQFNLAKDLRNAFPDDQNFKIIFAHHLFPGVETSLMKVSYVIPAKIKLKNILQTIIMVSIFPFIKLYKRYLFPRYYNNTYLYSNNVVLLSKQLIEPFMNYGKIHEYKKFAIIHNALSYNDFYPTEKLDKKKKKILIVSRLVENPKRILFAIKAWEKIYKDYPTWTLTIIGTGADEHLYKRYCIKRNIKNIFFEGNKDPKDYYMDASIFLMTSKLESWGLTITEAQQFGVVPIALNSYPTLPEIITNEQNGIIIKDNDLSAYTNAIKLLINNDQLRKEYAINAIISAKRFKSDIISKQWINLIQQKSI